MAPTGDSASPRQEGEAGDPTPRRTKTILIIICSVLFCAAIVSCFVIVLHFTPRQETVFLVRATDPKGLDPARSPVIHPAFDLTLRVANRGPFRDCWENLTVSVFYGDTTVGWGYVPDFCVGRRASVELKVAMSHADVVLSDELRGFMAAQLRAGELEFDVEMRMLLSKLHVRNTCDACASRQGFQLCTVNPGRQDYAPCELIYLLRP